MDQIQQTVRLLAFAGTITLTALIASGELPLAFAGPGVLCLATVGFFAHSYLKRVH